MTIGLRIQHWFLSAFALLALVSTGLTAEAENRPDLPDGFVSEAPLPEGFPPPSTPGRIVVKSYPASRTFSAGGGNAFFKCFSYLTLKRHEMTTPVVMDFPRGATRGSSPPDGASRMHFVLERPSLDKTGKKLLVEVADMPKLAVVSIAHQGELTAGRLQEFEKMLRDYAKTHKGLAIRGDLRVLGYNSPRVKPEKRFWEVQLPVKTTPKR